MEHFFASVVLTESEKLAFMLMRFAVLPQTEDFILLTWPFRLWRAEQEHNIN